MLGRVPSDGKLSISYAARQSHRSYVRAMSCCCEDHGLAIGDCLYNILIIVVVIRYETATTARLALLLIVRTFFNDTITIAVRTSFHVSLPVSSHKNPP
jgi:hypothetical protein